MTIAKGLGSMLVSASRLFSTPVFWLAKKGYRYLALPIYRTILFSRKQWKKIFGVSKGKLIHPLTARPVVHITVAILIFTVTAANIQASTLPTSSGESSILFSLMGSGDTGLIEETAATSRTPVSVSYMGPAYGVGVHQAQLTTAIPTTPDQIALVTSGGSAMASTPVMPGASRPGNTVHKNRTSTETYVVQSGDTVSTIAASFDLFQTTILWANNLTSRDYIRPGQKLKILPVDGVNYTVKKGDTLSKLAKVYAVSAEEIRQANDLEEDASLSVATELMIPGGKMIAPIVIARAPVINRIIDAITTPGASPESGSGSMIWPTSGHVITQYWGWRHTGVDIDGHYDSPIYASEAGVVEIAGWGNGYGIQAMLNHENGLKTRYGHMSKIYVTPGQRVNKGEVIGMVGTTGNSSGTHLHFEVYVNGVRGNPLLYVR